MDLDFRMHAERTPNPHGVKWVLSRTVVDDRSGVSFPEPVTADVSPIAARLHDVEGVTGVLLGANFIVVNKDPAQEWTDVAKGVVESIKAWVSSGEPALGEAYVPPEVGPEDEVVARIREVIERDIRPYVASDGGEVIFMGFHEGVVSVQLRGACAGCPSSSITLKMGIEARLKEEIPGVESVIAV